MGGRRAAPSTPKLSVVVFIVGLACLVVGILIGWASSRPKQDAFDDRWKEALKGEDDDVTDKILREMKPGTIKEYLKYLTSKAHLGGTDEQIENAAYIKEKWDEQGLDSTRIVRYNILLSYPRRDQPNHVYILLDNNTEVFRTAVEEEEIVEGDKLPNAVLPFNAYAKAGVVEGDLVYVNYGRAEDFQQLENELGINVTGKIAIARYGKGFRGEKAKQAHIYGAIGLILYSDPADYAIYGVDEVYPDTMFLPGTGVQRGNIITVQGDPLTQGYPAKDYMFRDDEKDVTLPQIPVQPISYNDAKEFLILLEGKEVPEGWAGKIPGVTYRIGPGLSGNRKVKLEVNNYNEIRPVHNVVGIIKGSLEPDRYVIIGNHRDAWNYGSLDPSSGTACMLEISRAFGKLVKNGEWRPRRSILFISWGAEEYGIMGAYEWIEEFGKTVAARTIAYLNVDIAVSGNHTFRVRASPSLFDVVYDASKKIPDTPDHGGTVFDTWLERNPRDDANLPSITTIRTGSDFRPFIMVIGVPSIDLRYERDMSLGTPSYPLYHTMYETFNLVTTVIDPTFQHHLVVSRVWAEIARTLSDTLIVPINCTAYADRIRSGVENLKELYQDKMEAREKPITFDAIDAQLAKFSAAAAELHQRIHDNDKTDPFAVRSVNDQLILMERAFIEPQGLPGRPFHRHMVFSPAANNKAYRDTFAVIADMMLAVENSDNPEAEWKEVERYMAIAAFTLDSAATTLMEVDVLANDDDVTQYTV